MTAFLALHNTLTRQTEPFAPIDPACIKMYVCGPTVYDFAHIGNARPVVVFDVLARLLRRLYPRLVYVRNITDIDDKIIHAAAQGGESIESITTRTTKQFHDDMAALGALPPDIEPRATDHVSEMIELIVKLIDRGHAYIGEDHVLFNVPSMPNYGRLSGRNRDEQIAGARVDVAPYKKDPADFVLWKPSTDDQPGWDSPWGRGRPGWHIECSAMAETHLGLPFDLHGGGLDLVFPHHENEIAQSCGASDCGDSHAMARYWLHNGFLMVEGQKMSKSLGNFLTVRELLNDFQGEVIRLTLLATHYRQPIDFTRDGLKQSKQTLDRLYGVLRAAADLPINMVEPPTSIMAALCDDLNTPQAIVILHELVTATTTAKDSTKRAEARDQLLAAGLALGLLQQEPESWLHWQPTGAGLEAAAIEAKILARQQARKDKNFLESDRIRDELLAAGIMLEDGPKGTIWRRA
jgi:cysteinyl-tRNA synthetase